MRSVGLAVIVAITIVGAAVLEPGLVSAQSGGASVVFDMDTVRHRPTTAGKDKTPIGTAELAAGKVGKACKFTFKKGAQSGFFTASIRPSTAWDRAAGLSFWIKGDGSSSFGGLEMIDASNYALRYGYCFPIDSTEWRKITVPWCDLVPELPAGQPVDPEKGYAPSKFGNLWFGKWYYWRDYPASSFAIDQIALEPKIDVDPTDYTPQGPGASRLLAKLKSAKPVTIVTMGDSLSDTRHWANRKVIWSKLLAAKLTKRFGSEVTLVNPAIGGTHLTQNLVLMPRWLKDIPQPDLVIVWFGYNDWSSGMRGPHFRKMLSFAVDRIRRMTKGRSEVMLVTTCPAAGRWDTMEELAGAVRAVAGEKNTALADVSAAFHNAAADNAARLKLFVSDKTHLAPAGHELAADTVVNAIADPKPAAVKSEQPQPRLVPKSHPRLLGSRQRLQRLAKQRASDYKRVAAVARKAKDDDHATLMSMALVCAIEGDKELGRQAVSKVMKTIGGPIPKGHTPFGSTLARCAIVYDLCYESWTPQQRTAFHTFMNRVVDANVQSETHVFHNGWYGYKHWGIGLACYATYYENARAPAILAGVKADFRTRAAPALELAGDGGGWAEGYYIHYWLYEWLFFCEVARLCDGTDYYAMAPKFFTNRAVAGMFEIYPGISKYGSRRPIPMGDGGGRVFGGDRDKALSARRILAGFYRDDPASKVVHAFNETTPRSAVGVYAYKDFLWRDSTIETGDLASFKLSYFSGGPGYVYARSSWDDTATHFFFKCGDRFTAHQHLDVGNFMIYRHGDLVGDGGHYDGFGTPHDVNYHLRTIAHNTIRVYDPDETWPGIRAGRVTGNDGGQHHNWPHHNGAVTDPAAWKKGRKLYDIADMLAFEDRGGWLYTAGDCSRAYSPKKLDYFTRQIVYIRPGTFVIFDRVAARDANFKKTWTLQTAKRPEGQGSKWTVTNGKGRLSIQTLLPAKTTVKFISGDELYSYDGKTYPPKRNTGPAPECRMEVSPAKPAKVDHFLHVLTATDASTAAAPEARVTTTDTQVQVTVGKTAIAFTKPAVSGSITFNGVRRTFPTKITPAAKPLEAKLPMEIPVLVIKYFPVKGDLIDVGVTGDWGASLKDTRAKTDKLTAMVSKALQDGSRYHGYKNPRAKPSLVYRIVKTIEYLEPLPTTPRPGHKVPNTDYNAIMKKIGIRKWVEDKGVKQVWIWGYHGGVVNLWESNMAGPSGDISNSNRDPKDLPVLKKTYTVYHYNYQRGASEAVEDHMHQFEAVLNHVDGRHRTPPDKWDTLLFWGKFVGSDRTHKIVRPGCGWSHYPPNAKGDYDWANKRFVETDIEDWRPDGKGARERINCQRWEGNSLKWFIYWMQNLPGADSGLICRGKRLTNWWVFIGDFDAAMDRSLKLIEK